MQRRLLVAAAGLSTALLLASAALSQNSATPKLTGTVGPGYTIKLKKGSTKVSSLKAGKYAFAIADKSSIHNFTLEQEKGGKFEKRLTGTSFTGNKSMTVTLKKGKWKYYCSVHEDMMFGFFTVKWESRSEGASRSLAISHANGERYFLYAYLILPSATSSSAIVR
jgi:plastocyanin